jgi:F-type H+-transporting ATPase subunit a
VAGQAMGLEWAPAGTLLVPIKLLTCVVQAMIFSLLTCVYISLVTHHEHDDHGHEAAGAH